MDIVIKKPRQYTAYELIVHCSLIFNTGETMELTRSVHHLPVHYKAISKFFKKKI